MSRHYWLVGSSFGGDDDQTERFLQEGIWEISTPSEKDQNKVRQMAVGERIAIKAAYTRKHDLAFETHGHFVAVMAIKAVGTITANLQDGERVSVDWEPRSEIREWYFHTYQRTIWQLSYGDNWKTDALLDFVFDGQPQDIDRFRNPRFEWTVFFAAIAKALLAFKDNRQPLLDWLHQATTDNPLLDYLSEDQYANGENGPLQDICPFTLMGSFNRSLTPENRHAIAKTLAEFLQVSEPVPEQFAGVPLLNNQRSWFFAYDKNRQKGDIDRLWGVFAAAFELTQGDVSTASTLEFIQAYDNALKNWGVKWNLSTGLFWALPWEFPTLDGNSRNYLKNDLGIPVSRNAQTPIKGTEYLKLIDDLKTHFDKADFAVHSFPELSLAAYGEQDIAEPASSDDVEEPEVTHTEEAYQPYSLDDIWNDGCFLDEATLKTAWQQLQNKRNLILQGPPGTGKTWLAKRLGYALIGWKDARRLRSVQFHQNLSYEDFVRGFRPQSDGKLAVVDGVFMEVVNAALAQPEQRFVVVIEEVNRGNPAQIFGELLTLLEASKRTLEEALELSYPDTDGKRRPVYIPKNLYVIGTMNLADRSLALVDMALRRRFAFVALQPAFNEKWHRWMTDKCNVDPELAKEIQDRLQQLNQNISSDLHLGPNFCVGHSYFTPASLFLEQGGSLNWYLSVVETEIRPLLDEYWFDAPNEVDESMRLLTDGLPG